MRAIDGCPFSGVIAGNLCGGAAGVAARGCWDRMDGCENGPARPAGLPLIVVTDRRQRQDIAGGCKNGSAAKTGEQPHPARKPMGVLVDGPELYGHRVHQPRRSICHASEREEVFELRLGRRGLNHLGSRARNRFSRQLIIALQVRASAYHQVQHLTSAVASVGPCRPVPFGELACFLGSPQIHAPSFPLVTITGVRSLAIGRGMRRNSPTGLAPHADPWLYIDMSPEWRRRGGRHTESARSPAVCLVSASSPVVLPVTCRTKENYQTSLHRDQFLRGSEGTW